MIDNLTAANNLADAQLFSRREKNLKPRREKNLKPSIVNSFVNNDFSTIETNK